MSTHHPFSKPEYHKNFILKIKMFEKKGPVFHTFCIHIRLVVDLVSEWGENEF